MIRLHAVPGSRSFRVHWLLAEMGLEPEVENYRIGDGSLGYCIGELETARRYNIPAVNIVLNNGTLGYEKFLIKYFNKPGELTEEYPGCDYVDTDYAAIARAFGCVGIRVEHPSELRPALEKAFGSGRPAVIDVVIDPDVIPPITFFPEADRSL